MADTVQLRPPRDLNWTLQVPGSKSITNRALLFAALGRGRCEVSGCLDAEDTTIMRACLKQLGVPVEQDGTTLTVAGIGGRFPAAATSLFVGTAGTVARLLLPAVAASPVQADVDGTPRMRERPMATLLDGLVELGAHVEYQGEAGLLPARIGPCHTGLRGGEVRLARPASSQFVSGLVVAGALANAPVRIVLEQGTPARPYVDMTLQCLRAFGGDARWVEGAAVETLEVIPGPLAAARFSVESDASAASYPLTLAAIHGGHARVDVGSASMQGDAHFAGVLKRLGANVEQSATHTTVEGGGKLSGGTFDLTDMPDMTLTLAAAALFCEHPVEIHGVEILRHHESDRLHVAATELRKLGATVEERDDGLHIVPPAAGPTGAVEIDTYDDHRVAMAFSLVGDVVIRDPGCVAKTYPTYFEHLTEVGMVEP